MNKGKNILKRKTRVKEKTRGTSERPRLSVFKSNRFVYSQLIDDASRKTILGVSEKHLAEKKTGGKTVRAKELGALLAKKANDKKIKKVVFDRGKYPYHGRVSAIAEGAREGGLEL